MTSGSWLQVCVLTLVVTAVASQAPQQPEDIGSKDWVHNYLTSLSQAKSRKAAGQSQLVCQWKNLEFEWPCDYVREFYQEKGLFDPAENVLGGIDVYNNNTFVTVPRSSDKIPAGLNKVVEKEGKSLLQPYPNLTFNELGKCSNLQFPVATSTDQNSGYMYVIDVGGVKKFPVSSEQTLTPDEEIQKCPPKLVVLDVKMNGTVVRSHDLSSAEPRNSSYLKDLVLDYAEKNSTQVKYAYITDTGNQRLIVFNFDTNSTYSFEHDSMKCGPQNKSTMGSKYNISGSINSIAVDPEYEYAYYNCLGSQRLSQIPTAVLRNSVGDFAGKHRFVGNTTTQSDRLVCGKKGLYYAGLDTSTVYRWNITQDLKAQNVSKEKVTIKNQAEIFKNGTGDYLISSITLDNNNSLWLTQSALTPDFNSTKGNNYKIFRVIVNDTNILSP